MDKIKNLIKKIKEKAAEFWKKVVEFFKECEAAIINIADDLPAAINAVCVILGIYWVVYVITRIILNIAKKIAALAFIFRRPRIIMI